LEIKHKDITITIIKRMKKIINLRLILCLSAWLQLWRIDKAKRYKNVCLNITKSSKTFAGI